MILGVQVCQRAWKRLHGLGSSHYFGSFWYFGVSNLPGCCSLPISLANDQLPESLRRDPLSKDLFCSYRSESWASCRHAFSRKRRSQNGCTWGCRQITGSNISWRHLRKSSRDVARFQRQANDWLGNYLSCVWRWGPRNPSTVWRSICGCNGAGESNKLLEEVVQEQSQTISAHQSCSVAPGNPLVAPRAHARLLWSDENCRGRPDSGQLCLLLEDMATWISSPQISFRIQSRDVHCVPTPQTPLTTICKSPSCARGPETDVHWTSEGAICWPGSILFPSWWFTIEIFANHHFDDWQHGPVQIHLSPLRGAFSVEGAFDDDSSESPHNWDPVPRVLLHDQHQRTGSQKGFINYGGVVGTVSYDSFWWFQRWPHESFGVHPEWQHSAWVQKQYHATMACQACRQRCLSRVV